MFLKNFTVFKNCLSHLDTFFYSSKDFLFWFFFFVCVYILTLFSDILFLKYGEVNLNRLNICITELGKLLILSGSLSISSWIFWIHGGDKSIYWGKKKKKHNSWRVSKIELDWISSGFCSTLASLTCHGSCPSYSINEKRMAKKYLQVFSKQTLLPGDVLLCIRTLDKANVSATQLCPIHQ